MCSNAEAVQEPTINLLEFPGKIWTAEHTNWDRMITLFTCVGAKAQKLKVGNSNLAGTGEWAPLVALHTRAEGEAWLISQEFWKGVERH